MNNRDEVRAKAKELLNDVDTDVIMLVMKGDSADTIYSLGDSTIDLAIGTVTVAINQLDELREALMTEMADTAMSKHDDDLTLALLKLTALRQINPELEDDLFEIGQLVAKALGDSEDEQ
jgi:hypothetical protein